LDDVRQSEFDHVVIFKEHSRSHPRNDCAFNPFLRDQTTPSRRAREDGPALLFAIRYGIVLIGEPCHKTGLIKIMIDEIYVWEVN
jgi:hypothetical protein